MRGEQAARLRRGLWPLLVASWLLLACVTVFDQGVEPPTATTSSDSEKSEVEPEPRRLEPPRGIRPPWREPLIPEKRRSHQRRHRAWPA